jgi:hypothetical protein
MAGSSCVTRLRRRGQRDLDYTLLSPLHVHLLRRDMSCYIFVSFG